MARLTIWVAPRHVDDLRASVRSAQEQSSRSLGELAAGPAAELPLHRIGRELRVAVMLRSAARQLERPSATAAPVRIAMTGMRADLVRMVRRVDGARRLQDVAAGLSAFERAALQLLDRLGPMTAAQLGDRLGLSRGGVTALVVRLERIGVVEREPAEDGPRIRVRSP
jgi:hypothetical protein